MSRKTWGLTLSNLCDKIVFLGVGGKLCFAGSPNDALDFFKVDDFVDIYTMLNNDTDTWYKEFEKIKPYL
jgi:hypothetical protein